MTVSTFCVNDYWTIASIKILTEYLKLLAVCKMTTPLTTPTFWPEHLKTARAAPGSGWCWQKTRSSIIQPTIYRSTALPWKLVWHDHVYANMFLGKLEWEFLHTQDMIPWVRWRYIDNIFAMWDHGEPSLQVFIDNLNWYHPTIKSTAMWSAEEVTLLRVFLKDGEIGTLPMSSPQTPTSTS